MFLIIALVLFGIYVTNVFLGATSDTAFMTDVPEMVTLFIAAVFFTVGILQREAAAKANDKNTE